MSEGVRLYESGKLRRRMEWGDDYDVVKNEYIIIMEGNKEHKKVEGWKREKVRVY